MNGAKRQKVGFKVAIQALAQESIFKTFIRRNLGITRKSVCIYRVSQAVGLGATL